MASSLPTGKLLQIEAEGCQRSTGDNVCEAKSTHGVRASLVDCFKIFMDKRQQVQQTVVNLADFLVRFIPVEDAVAFLGNRHQPCCSEKAAGNLAIQEVHPVPNTSGQGKLEPIKLPKNQLSMGDVENKKTLSDPFAYKSLDGKTDEAIRSAHFARDLSENEKLFSTFAVLSSLRFFDTAVSLAFGDMGCFGTRIICCNAKFPYRECRGGGNPDAYPSDYQGSQSNQRCTATTNGGPSLPPRPTDRPQRPALAKSIKHAHSLIPLWTGQHSAMASPHLERSYG